MELAINLAPFAIAILLLLFSYTSDEWISRLKHLPMVLTTITMAVLFVLLLDYYPKLPESGAIEFSAEWVPALGLSLSYYIDGLSLLFGLIVTGIGALICIYVGRYFGDDIKETREKNRFYIILMAFAGAMLGLVMAGNTILLFIMWELTSVTSFLLIGFKGEEYEGARKGALQAFLVTGAGALALIIGLVVLGTATGQIVDPESGILFVNDLGVILKTNALAEHPWYPIFAILIILGCMTKSAQFPFHFWLPGAKFAPTPASSYLHSATMVKAGIFLLLRLHPVLSENPLWTEILVPVGVFTMIFGAYFAFQQRDLKSLLAYSTVSKLGAIVAMIGLPGDIGIKAALLGILAHALYKAPLFLVAGTVQHAAHTRDMNELGGLWRIQWRLAIVTLISGMSMAGVIPLFGFIAKEAMLESFLEGSTSLAFWLVVIASVFTVMTAVIFFYEIFMGEHKPKLEGYIKSHPLPRGIDIAPMIMALGSLVLGLQFLLDLVISPLLSPVVGEHVHLETLHLPINEIFLVSLGILFFGFILSPIYDFGIRNTKIQPIRNWIAWREERQRDQNNPAPTYGEWVFEIILQMLDSISTWLLKLQNGKVRYYLVFILGTVSIIIIISNRIIPLERSTLELPQFVTLTSIDIMRIVLLTIAIGSVFVSIVVKNHLVAAVCIGVMGYAVGGVFLIEPAPDVALVQFLVETLSTVLIIIMLSRISPLRRQNAMKVLWEGHSRYFRNSGIVRDIIIATIVGVTVGAFALIAVANRDNRESITQWHIENTVEEAESEDIVGAIVTDFRGTDTLIEITVVSAAALGIFAILSRQRAPLSESSTPREDPIFLSSRSRFSTPAMRVAAIIIFPIAILIAISQLLYGSGGVGDGFTAGVVTSLAIAMWYLVYGYQDVKRRLKWLNPWWFMVIGLTLGLANAIFPIFLSEEFLAHMSYDKLIGIHTILEPLGLHFSSAVVFELAIAITVFGAMSMIMDSISHPRSEYEQETA